MPTWRSFPASAGWPRKYSRGAARNASSDCRSARWGDGPGPARKPLDPLRVGLPACRQQRPGQDARGLDEGRVVEQREGLLRRVGDGADGGAFLARRGVEVRQHRVQERPLPVHVDAAAVLAFVAIGHVVAVGELEVRVVAGRLIGDGARAADVQVEQAGDRQRVVADELGLEPPRRLGGEQAVVRVDLAELGPRLASPGGRSPTSRSA